jgi:hypothetical protein
MNQLKDLLAKNLFGLTVGQAHDMMVCIACKRDIEQFLETERERNEYNVSGLCFECFNKFTGD